MIANLPEKLTFDELQFTVNYLNMNYTKPEVRSGAADLYRSI